MKSNRPLVAILFLLAFCQTSHSQEPTPSLDKITSFPSRFFDKLQQKSADLEDKIIANSEKALKKLARQEARLKWQQSGLVGVSKIISLKSKLFKKNNAAVIMGFFELSSGTENAGAEVRVG